MTYSGAELWTMFVDRDATAEDVLRTTLDDDGAAASDIADLIGDAYAEGDYERDTDGMIDLYSIVHALRREGERLVAQAEEQSTEINDGDQIDRDSHGFECYIPDDLEDLE